MTDRRLQREYEPPPLLSQLWGVSADALTEQVDPEPLPDFREWVSRSQPNYEWNWHHESIADHLQAVANGELQRLIVEMPPQHGKSELCSRKFPAYYLRKWPTRFFGLVAHTATFAGSLSKAARTNFLLSGGELESYATYSWDTVEGGGLWAGGVDTGVAGRPMHCGLLDDQFKNSKQAMSSVIRRAHVEWWDSVFENRLQETGALIIVMTRWTERDLAGTVLKRAKENPESLGWTILRYDALRETKSINLVPENCRLRSDLDTREDGEALWPERFSAGYLRNRKRNMLPYYWEALYQQRPVETAGRGRVAKEFDAHNIRELEDPGGVPFEVGLDFNVEPMWAVAGVKVADQFHVLWEFILHDANTDEMARKLVSFFGEAGKTRGINVHPDPTGRRRQTASKGRTDFGILEEHGLKVIAPNAPWAVDDRINTFDAACRVVEPAPARFYIDPSCEETITCLNNHVFKPETRDPDKASGYDHGYDATTYAVMNLLPMPDMMKQVKVKPLTLRPKKRRAFR